VPGQKFRRSSPFSTFKYQTPECYFNFYLADEFKFFGAIGFRKNSIGVEIFDGNAASALGAGPAHVPIRDCSVDGAPQVFSATSGVSSRSPEIDSVDGFQFFLVTNILFGPN